MEWNCSLGDSGAPVMVSEDNLIHENSTNKYPGAQVDDLLVGIVSCANYSALHDSGIGVIPIANIRDWLDTFSNRKVISVMCFPHTELMKLFATNFSTF